MKRKMNGQQCFKCKEKMYRGDCFNLAYIKGKLQLFHTMCCPGEDRKIICMRCDVPYFKSKETIFMRLGVGFIVIIVLKYH
jgi:hypothetical protein